MKPLTPLFLLIINLSFFSPPMYGQISFSNQTHLFQISDFHSIQPIGVADMNGDGLDDVIHLGWYDPDDDGNYEQVVSIEYQSSEMGNPFTAYVGPMNSQPWGLCVGDIDNNGFNDLLYGGFEDHLKILSGKASIPTITDSLRIPIYLQGINFVDLNNDGWLDIYACDDIQTNTTFKNDGTGGFDVAYDLAPLGQGRGNYASLWSDYDVDGDLDLYISKCVAGVSGQDPARKNLFYRNNDKGNNNFTHIGPNVAADPNGVADTSQSWAADFADFDNDGDMDLFILNHPALFGGPNSDKSALYRQVNPNNFIDIIDQSGLPTTVNGDWQVFFRDFDNDGWLDLIYTGSAIHFGIYRNNGNLTFSKILNPFSYPLPIRNCAVGDLNHDGFLDILASYSSWTTVDPWESTPADQLWINEGNDNHFVAIQLTGVNSNKNAVGARLELYGDWEGVQMREIRSGESYGIMNTFTQHFGLGSHTAIDSLVIYWPSGIRQTEANVAIDQFHQIAECISDHCLTTMPTVVKVQAKVLLKGAYTGNGEMSHNLRNFNLLPTSTPYNSAPWNHMGNELVSNKVDIPANITDWILMELQDIHHNTVATTSGFLTATGDVVDVDGLPGLSFAVTPGDYYVIIRHRNHIDIASNKLVSLSAGTAAFYNFTIGGNIAGGAGQIVNLNGLGLFGMIPGDFDGNGVINHKDFNDYQHQLSAPNGYNQEDINLNGFVHIDDFNVYQEYNSRVGVSIVRY